MLAVFAKTCLLCNPKCNFQVHCLVVEGASAAGGEQKVTEAGRCRAKMRPIKEACNKNISIMSQYPPKCHLKIQAEVEHRQEKARGPPIERQGGCTSVDGLCNPQHYGFTRYPVLDQTKRAQEAAAIPVKTWKKRRACLCRDVLLHPQYNTVLATLILSLNLTSPCVLSLTCVIGMCRLTQ